MGLQTNLAPRDYQPIGLEMRERFMRWVTAWQTQQGLDDCPVLHELSESNMKPDVIVISDNNTLMFEPKTLQASNWLSKRYRLPDEASASILVHPQNRHQLIADLKNAGFTVTE